MAKKVVYFFNHFIFFYQIRSVSCNKSAAVHFCPTGHQRKFEDKIPSVAVLSIYRRLESYFIIHFHKKNHKKRKHNCLSWISVISDISLVLFQLFSWYVQCEWTGTKGKPPSLAELHSQPSWHILRWVSQIHPAEEEEHRYFLFSPIKKTDVRCSNIWQMPAAI